ncbi:helix-turn-helix domain-containing protein [Azospirillum brasilense]|uniref:helix-turn-helix domain-containing protein n=1 Tax=Azospirillum brasilense TaxID=192 RepID=UPI00190B6BDD|nr:helix-turn-helix transcriptional regulator [Azospirillum brasilense]MBK3735704.1 helix-turn-helix domain-containing protein [Azospirillum brasilense]
MLTAKQIRAARALLGWSQADLAAVTKLSVPTIKRMEGAKGPDSSTAANVASVQRALEDADVQFIAEGELSPDGGVGVRLRKEKPQTA